MTMINLQALRFQVQTWLDENVPRDLVLPTHGEEMSPELVAWTLDFRRKLGAQGWLAPNWPKYLGGGGLPGAAGAVIRDELGHRRLPPLGLNQTWLTPLRVWGTEEQKGKWLPPTLRGEITVYQIVSERAQGGADLAFQATTALRDGDDYLVNGEKGPFGAQLPPDFLFILVTTDPHGPKYENLAMMIVDAHDPGVSVRVQRTLTGTTLKSYAFKDVRVPPENIIGGEVGGWQVALTLVDVERGNPGVTPDQRVAVEERERAYWLKSAG